jgi:hypothetical protein
MLEKVLTSGLAEAEQLGYKRSGEGGAGAGEGAAAAAEASGAVI